jgi:putative endonuclease
MYAYIISNFTNSVLYTGTTNNLERRIFEHRNGLIKNSFSEKYRLYKLLWFEQFNSPLEAIAAEKKIKGWTRAKKIYLIKQINSELKDLSNALLDPSLPPVAQDDNNLIRRI